VPTQRSASEPIPEPVSVPAQLSFSGPAGAVLQAVARGAKRLDDLCDQTGLSAAEVQRLLLTLRLEGVLVSDGAGGFAPATP
jgi:predicted Rossmann fold nucleotide-binding protein DprA/Smf involved in DNA uptake